MMAETAHKSVLKEIEKSRVISVFLQENSRDDYDFSRSAKAEQSRTTGVLIRANTEIGDKRGPAHVQSTKKGPNVCDGPGEHDLDTRKLSSTLNSRDTTFISVSEILNHGMLYKTSRGKITSDLTRGQHEHRQYRRFQLTEHSLEYSQLLQRVSSYIYRCMIIINMAHYRDLHVRSHTPVNTGSHDLNLAYICMQVLYILQYARGAMHTAGCMHGIYSYI